LREERPSMIKKKLNKENKHMNVNIEEERDNHMTLTPLLECCNREIYESTNPIS